MAQRRYILIQVGCLCMASLLVTPLFSTNGLTVTSPLGETDILIEDLLEAIDSTMMGTYILTLQNFGPKVTGSENCTRAQEYISNEFHRMGYPVKTGGYLSGDYVEATLDGSNTSSDKILIVCGHYDTVPGSPGADDNGSGTAAVLATAKVLSEHQEDYRIEHTIRFVTFSGEEQGLLGSEAYAGEAYENGDNIMAVLNADMIAYTETPQGATTIRVYEKEVSAWITNQTMDVAEKYREYVNLSILRLPSSSNSDHWPFLQHGYDAICYNELDPNRYYHSPQDTLDKLDLDYATRSTRLILATLLDLANTVGIDTEKPIIHFTKPKGGYIYLWDRELCPAPSGYTIILGKINTFVTALDTGTGIEKVEIYLDGTLQYTDTVSPYEWLWDDTVFGDHTLKAVGYDNAGNSASEEREIFIFNIAQ